MGYKYKISNNGFATVSISKMEEGVILYAERNSCIACSPIATKAEEGTGLWRRRVLSTELNGENYTHEKKPTPISQAWADFKLGTKKTIDRKRIGERSYVLYEALEDGQKATFRTCFPGTIMPWNARPLEKDEVYVKEKNSGEIPKSIYNEDENERPHGTLIAVRGSFLVADIKVAASVYHTGKVEVLRFSETMDSFQKFSGQGMVFLEVHGDLQEIPLHPDESVDVFPGYLLGFSEGIKLEMKPAGDVTLRNEENNDYVIRLKAGEKGGYVYTHSVKPLDFFRRKENHQE